MEEVSLEEGDFDVSHQDWVVVNITHTHMSPPSKEAGVRFGGVYPSDLNNLNTSSLAKNYAKKLFGLDDRLTILTLKRFQWLLLVKEPSLLTNKTYIGSKIKLNLEKFKRGALEGDRALELLKENTNSKTESNPAPESNPTPLTTEEEYGDYTYPPSLKRADQRFAAVIFVPDASTDDPSLAEPMIAFLATFPTESLCINWIKKVGSKRIKDFNIDCVSMYEWLYPLSAGAKVKQEYRDPLLNNIMKSQKHKNEMNQVWGEMTKEMFEQLCAGSRDENLVEEPHENKKL